MTDSRPPAVVAEAQRIAEGIIAHVHNDIEWRIKISESVARNEATSSFTQLRIEAHEKIDDERFGRIFNGQPSISSQVSGLRSDHEQIAGAKRILQYVGIFFAWLISTGIAIWAARK